MSIRGTVSGVLVALFTGFAAQAAELVITESTIIGENAGAIIHH